MKTEYKETVNIYITNVTASEGDPIHLPLSNLLTFTIPSWEGDTPFFGYKRNGYE